MKVDVPTTCTVIHVYSLTKLLVLQTVTRAVLRNLQIDAWVTVHMQVMHK